MIDQIILFVISIVANTMSAFAGGGAGLLQFPAIIFLGLPFAIALATHKTATFALGLGALYRNWQKKEQVDWRFAAFIMICGLPGTILGAWIIIKMPEHIAELVLGVLTIGIGVYSALKKQLGQTALPLHRDRIGLIIGGIILFLIGVYNGSFASGSGLFVTMWLIIWFGCDYKMAVIYTMTLVGFFWNGAGALSLIAMGAPVQWSWMPALLVGSFLGGYLGAHIGSLKGNLWIKRGFEIVTMLSGSLLIYKGLS